MISNKPTQKMTHKEIVNRSAVWLMNRSNKTEIDTQLRCQIILREPTGYVGCGNEQPDVLGIWGNGAVNIECKVSRSDFFNEKNKLHNHPLGAYKIYACPKGLIQPDGVPEMEIINYGVSIDKLAEMLESGKLRFDV